MPNRPWGEGAAQPVPLMAFLGKWRKSPQKRGHPDRGMAPDEQPDTGRNAKTQEGRPERGGC